MAQVVRKHSEGMISINAEDMKTSESSIAFVEQSQLFKQLITLIGVDQANAVIGKYSDPSLASRDKD